MNRIKLLQNPLPIDRVASRVVFGKAEHWAPMHLAEPVFDDLPPMVDLSMRLGIGLHPEFVDLAGHECGRLIAVGLYAEPTPTKRSASSTDDKGFASMLEPEVPFTLDSTAVVVASVGDNPSFREELGDALQALLSLFSRLFGTWHKSEPQPHTVSVSIDNRGANGLRVLLGSNTSEVQVNPGDTYVADAIEYVEIRELGV